MTLTTLGWVFVGLSLAFIVICIAVGAVATEMYVRLQQNPPWAQALGDQNYETRRMIMAAVQIEQADIDAFATTVTTEVTAIGAVVGVIQTYITKLLAGQAVPLSAADESGLNTALSALGTSVGTLQGLEPPVVVPPGS